MNIQGIQNYASYDIKLKLSKQKAPKVDIISSDRVKKDTYEPADIDERKKRLASIKKKIKSGYYNSDEVAEDLSESFAKVFDNLL